MEGSHASFGDKIEDKETGKAFLAMILKIHRKFEEQGGNYPPSLL